MSRTIPSALLSALTASQIEPYFAVELIFDSGTLRLWTGYGERTIDGETYVGAGDFLSVGGMDETADLSAKSATITLSGVASELVSLSLQEPYQRRKVRVLFGERSVTDFIVVFSGQADTMRIVDTADSATIELTVESRLVELERPRIRRYTHEDHISRNPGDNFFSYVADLQDKSIVWGRKA